MFHAIETWWNEYTQAHTREWHAKIEARRTAAVSLYESASEGVDASSRGGHSVDVTRAQLDEIADTLPRRHQRALARRSDTRATVRMLVSSDGIRTDPALCEVHIAPAAGERRANDIYATIWIHNRNHHLSYVQALERVPRHGYQVTPGLLPVLHNIDEAYCRTTIEQRKSVVRIQGFSLSNEAEERLLDLIGHVLPSHARNSFIITVEARRGRCDPSYDFWVEFFGSRWKVPMHVNSQFDGVFCGLPIDTGSRLARAQFIQ